MGGWRVTLVTESDFFQFYYNVVKLFLFKFPSVLRQCHVVLLLVFFCLQGQCLSLSDSSCSRIPCSCQTMFSLTLLTRDCHLWKEEPHRVYDHVHSHLPTRWRIIRRKHCHPLPTPVLDLRWTENILQFPMISLSSTPFLSLPETWLGRGKKKTPPGRCEGVKNYRDISLWGV